MEQDQDDSGAELQGFVRELNRIEGGDSCRIVRQSEPLFDALRQRFPPALGGIDWRKATLLESSGPPPEETGAGLLGRVSGHWKTLQSFSGSGTTGRVFILSDDFFNAALDCGCAAVPRVLEEWLALPHAIAICTHDYEFCLHVALCRSVYVGHVGRANSRRGGTPGGRE